MTRKSLLQDSIEKRLAEERYVIPKEKKRRRRFNFQWLIGLSLLIALLLTIFKLLAMI